MPNRAAFVGASFFLATCNAPPDTVVARSTPSPTPSHEAAVPRVPDVEAKRPPPRLPPPREPDPPPREPDPVAVEATAFVPPAGFVPYGLLGPVPPAPDPPPRRRRPVRPPPDAIPVGLAHSLRSQDVRAGMARAKTNIKRCVQDHPTDQHGQTRLRIKVGVSGATGRVTDAKVEPLFAGTDLARCLEAVVSRTRYPRFARERVAFSFPIRL